MKSCVFVLSVILFSNGAIAADLPSQARKVLKHHCWRCHNGVGSEGGDFDVLNYKDLVEKSGMIVAGKLDESFLFERVLKNEMPPRSLPDRPAPLEIDALRNWIAQGAEPFADEAERKFVSIQNVYEAARDHLKKSPQTSRPFLRYFTLHTLSNNNRVSEEDLQVYRAGLSKTWNSLSTNSKIHVPRSVVTTGDDLLNGLLYVVDLRDYGWTADEHWSHIERAYPYGLNYGNLQELSQVDKTLQDETESILPVIRADWFIAEATRPPLYHLLLKLPESAKTLEADLGVDIASHFSKPVPNQIARAGFAKSGVSAQNRMVERNDSALGMYWKSYDFKPGSPRSKLTRFPLGPANLFPATTHPFREQAFIHDGGEIIWRLPNGLQAYLLIDGEDRRIDEGPIDVVNDPLETSGTPSIVNGVSCMACHKHGVIDFTDQIHDNSAMLGEPLRHVRSLYPDAQTWQKLLDEDRKVFMTALDQTIGEFVEQSIDHQKALTEFTEPVGEVSRWHRLVYLDLQTIASELDLEDPQELVRQVGAKRLKQLGLESLLQPGGSISRADWEAIDGISLMQELARELKYTPKRGL